MKDIVKDLSRAAYVMFNDGWKSGDLATWAAAEIITLREKLEKAEAAQAGEGKLEKLPAAFEVLDPKRGTYLVGWEDAARNSGYEYNGLYRRDGTPNNFGDDGKDKLIRELVATLKYIKGEAEDRSEKPGWRMDNISDHADAALTKAKAQGGYEP
jgi:hypothetical protein